VDPTTKKTRVTDFISFYILPSHVMKNPKHNMLNVKLFYYLGLLFIFKFCNYRTLW